MSTEPPTAPTAPFTAHEIQDAARAFGHAADDLQAAERDLWGSSLAAFVHLCREDRVLRHVTEPLRAWPVDAAAWWEQRRQANGTAGSVAPIKLPAERTEAAALLLKLLEWFADTEMEAVTVLWGIVGHEGGNHDDRIRRTSDILLGRLCPYVDGQLDAMYRAAAPAPPAPGTTIYNTQQINAPANVVNQGSTLNHSPITANQSVTYQATSELGQEIMGWSSLLEQVERHRHAEVQQAIVALACAADEGGAKASRLVQAAEIVVEAHPTLRAKVGDALKRWGGGAATVAGALVKGAAAEAGKQLVQHQEQVLQALSLALGG